ncbi:MAG: hypothetical protein P8M78_17885 [Myxococcota bacterium]|nr:hypothetical protein [Myxococcota bacterium]
MSPPPLSPRLPPLAQNNVTAWLRVEEKRAHHNFSVLPLYTGTSGQYTGYLLVSVNGCLPSQGLSVAPGVIRPDRVLEA